MVRLEWRHRASPLRPQAVLALDPDLARRLEQAVGALPEARQSRLHVLSGPDGALLLTGNCVDLPWLDGLGWLGVSPEAPQLWLPTHMEPTLSPELVVQACARRAPGGRRWLLWPLPALLWALKA